MIENYAKIAAFGCIPTLFLLPLVLLSNNVDVKVAGVSIQLLFVSVQVYAAWKIWRMKR